MLKGGPPGPASGSDGFEDHTEVAVLRGDPEVFEDTRGELLKVAVLVTCPGSALRIAERQDGDGMLCGLSAGS